MRVQFSPRSVSDLEDIYDYIARDNLERAGTFIEELQDKCARIRDNPEAHALRSDVAPDIRMAVHRAYVILFRILPDEIRIERVLHGARNIPTAWKRWLTRRVSPAEIRRPFRRIRNACG